MRKQRAQQGDKDHNALQQLDSVGVCNLDINHADDSKSPLVLVLPVLPATPGSLQNLHNGRKHHEAALHPPLYAHNGPLQEVLHYEHITRYHSVMDLSCELLYL